MEGVKQEYCVAHRVMIEQYGFQSTFMVSAGLKLLSALPVFPLLVGDIFALQQLRACTAELQLSSPPASCAGDGEG